MVYPNSECPHGSSDRLRCPSCMRDELNLEIVELEKDKARVIRVAEQLLRMFGTPTLRDDAAVYTCHAEANIRTLEGISDAINAAKEE